MRRNYGYYPQPYNDGLGVRGVLVVTGIIIAMIIGVFIYARIQAEKAVSDQLPADYNKNTTPADSERIRAYTTSLQSDLDRTIGTGNDYDLYKELLSLTDVMFKNICIDYKRVTGKSLKAAVENHKTWFSLNQPIGSDLYNRFVNNMQRLSII
jgi:hypothetical protein